MHKRPLIPEAPGIHLKPLPVRTSASVRLIGGLIVMIAIGTLLLSLPGMTTRPLTLMDRIFTATSAVTVTGLTVVSTTTDYTFLGQIVILALVQTGGMGFVVMAVLTIRLFGGRLSLLNRHALSGELGVANDGSIWVALRRTIRLMLAIEAAGILLLYVHWRTSGIVAPDKALFYAIFHAITAFCNAGFDLFFGLAAYPDGLPGDALSLIILAMMIIAGGLGFPVYFDIIFRRGPRRLSLHSQVTLYTTVLLLLGGMIGILAGEYRFNEGVLANATFTERLITAGFQSASSRTAGFPGLESFETLHPSSRLVLIALMFVGSGPGSMGGGITTGTFAVVMLALGSFVRGNRQVRVFQRTVSPGTIQRALAVAVISVTLVIVATWLLLLTQPVQLDTALFEVISAFSTTGLTLGITDDLDTFGRIIIILMMAWGRLGALTIMIALLQRQPQDRLVDFPEENLLVG